MAQNNWGDDFRQPGNPDALPPAKAGMSSGMKVFLIILAVGGACVLLCCGIGGYVAYRWRPVESTDPVAVEAARDDIAKINFPPEFKPRRTFGMGSFMKIVEYEAPAIHGHAILFQFGMKLDRAQADQQMRQQLEVQRTRETSHLDNLKTETKTIKIKGRDSSVQFEEGTDPSTKQKRRQVVAAFDGKSGPAMLSIDMDASAFKEDQIVKMLESIQ